MEEEEEEEEGQCTLLLAMPQGEGVLMGT